MIIKKTKIPGVVIFKSKKYLDKRVYFLEVFKKKFIKNNFLYGCLSNSKKNVLRGLHLQKKFQQAKFITVLKGSIFDVVVDLRKRSKTYGKYFSITLSENNLTSLLIPKGCAHGFLTLGKENLVFYVCSEYWKKKHEISINWEDKKLKINWPSKKPILSDKDKNGISFVDFNKIKQ
jgi:dTDP-4-dehydrorhamnose 3,5-epimerase